MNLITPFEKVKENGVTLLFYNLIIIVKSRKKKKKKNPVLLIGQSFNQFKNVGITLMIGTYSTLGEVNL